MLRPRRLLPIRSLASGDSRATADDVRQPAAEADERHGACRAGFSRPRLTVGRLPALTDDASVVALIERSRHGSRTSFSRAPPTRKVP